MIKLIKVKNKDKELFWNINQKYLYEMTNYYDDEMDNIGNYHYGHFEEYFIDPKREAFFIYNDNILVGFAMLCPYSYINKSPDYTMAEFTIFPAFRKHHFARDAIKLMLDSHKGNWEIKYNEKNIVAKKMWTNVASNYQYKKYHLNDVETVLEFSNI